MRHTKKRSKQRKKSKKGARRYTRKGGATLQELKLKQGLHFEQWEIQWLKGLKRECLIE